MSAVGKLTALACLAMVAGCDNKPKHYFVLCEGKDMNGWNLIDTVKKDGYLLSCTYQSPDMQQAYTNRCDDNGCGIK